MPIASAGTACHRLLPRASRGKERRRVGQDHLDVAAPGSPPSRFQPSVPTVNKQSAPGAASPQLVQQCLRLFQIGRIEAFGEPAVDRCEKVAGFGSAALVAAEPGEADGGA